jgi:hypothetical protein
VPNNRDVTHAPVILVLDWISFGFTFAAPEGNAFNQWENDKSTQRKSFVQNLS